MRRSNKKRFNRPTQPQQQEGMQTNMNNSFGILPAPGILESYEEISPGSVKTIISIVKSEQDHRHRWENSYLRSMVNNYRFGQILIFILSIMIIYAAISFVSIGENLMAIFVIVFGFAFLAIVALANMFNKKEAMRPQHNHNRNFNRNKKK
ncbi:MAG: DUF2335 domain-containing protein [Alphaproteobacteria bacterium]|jgi:uncharacterized membrane protein|nr:DUF2335 domain-containing protein [Candidatus Jidaibacter sp.]